MPQADQAVLGLCKAETQTAFFASKVHLSGEPLIHNVHL